MVGVSDFLARVDIDPDCHKSASITGDIDGYLQVRRWPQSRQARVCRGTGASRAAWVVHDPPRHGLLMGSPEIRSKNSAAGELDPSRRQGTITRRGADKRRPSLGG